VLPPKAAVRQVQVPTTIKAPDKKALQQLLPVRLQAKAPIVLSTPATLHRVAIVTLLLPAPVPVVAVPFLAQAAVFQVEVLHVQVVAVAVLPLPQVAAEGKIVKLQELNF
jgi:hypothetical protein